MKNLVKKIVSLFKNPEPPHYHHWLEYGMTEDCDYGCKLMECRCGERMVSHRRVYGCPQG